jgi:hypothetical protein
MVEVVGRTGEQELIDEVREVTLLQSPEVRPYRAATIEIKEIALVDIKPTTLYVLRQNLVFQRELRDALETQGLDPLNLRGALTLRSTDGTVGLIPPLIEVDPGHGPCLFDGAHRTYIGREAGRKVIRAIVIEGADESYPLYAYPNEWDEIKEYDTVPPLKKRYREGDPAALYRNLALLNGSTMRTALD